MMIFTRLNIVLMLTLSLVMSHAEKQLPKCPYDDQTSEIQFYDVQIDVSNLPESCTEDDMVTIGIMIQKVVDEVEDRMPQYEGEKSITLICPFPREVEKRRNLQTTTTTTTTRRRRRTGRLYKYSGTGRACRRCSNKTTSRRRRVVLEEGSDDICAIAKRAQTRAERSASSCDTVLQNMKDKAKENGLGEDGALLEQAKLTARYCQEVSRVASDAAKSAMELCDDDMEEAPQFRSPSHEQVKKHSDAAVTASLQAKDALARVRRARFDLNTQLYVESIQNRRRDIHERVLADKDICDYHNDAEYEYDVTNHACKEIEEMLNGMKKIASDIDTNKAYKACEDTEHRLDKCQRELANSEKAKDIADSLCKRGKDNDLNKAKQQAGKAATYAERAVKYLTEARGFQTDLYVLNGGSSLEQTIVEATTMPPTTAPPTPAPTPSPSPAPTPSPTPPTPLPGTPEVTEEPIETPPTPLLDTPELVEDEIKLAPSQEEYLNRLSVNLESSNTACEEVKRAMIQKTIAEEDVTQSDATYDKIMDLASGYQGNKDVERIKAKAEKSHLRVEVEAIKARAAADLASEMCSKQKQTRLRNRRLFEKSIQEEVDIATTAVVESRLALSAERLALDEMEEVISLIEFDPTMADLEATFGKDEAVLMNHLASVETEIVNVDSQIIEQPDHSSLEASALEKKKVSLLEEEHQIEDVLANQEHFLIGESALKKDEYYESVSADFLGSPTLQYVLKYRKEGKNKSVETNWNKNAAAQGPKEAWFRRFGDYLVDDVPAWLMLSFNTSEGGCITEDADLFVDVIITELKTMWEKLNQDRECSREGDVKPTEEPDSTLSSCPVTASGPIPVGGRAIWSSKGRGMTKTPYYREFDGTAFETSTMQGADALERYTWGFGAASPKCYEELFVGVTPNHKITGTMWDGSEWRTILGKERGADLGSAVSSSEGGNNIVGAYESLSGNGMIVYTDTGSKDSVVRFMTRDDEAVDGWSSSRDVDPQYVAGVPMYFDIASNPNSNDIALTFSDGRDIFVAIWNGNSWTPIIDLTNISYPRGIDIAYESESGRAMVVHGWKQGNRGFNMVFQIWDGSTWEDQQVGFPLGDKGSISFITLRSDPSSDRLVVSAVVPRGCVLFSTWNGSEWETPEEGSCKVSGTDPSASVAFESESGNVLAVWGETGSSNVFYKTLTNGNATWSNANVAGDINGKVTSISLFANPDVESNQIMLMAKNDSDELYAAAWDGIQFNSFTELDSNVGDDAIRSFSFLWNPTI